MGKLTGRFYFKLTVNGNLLGEYSNHATDRSLTEAANRVVEQATNDTTQFVGDYDTTWHEGGAQSELARLEIKLKHARIYSVTWHQFGSNGVKGNPIFDGEAMLCDSILVGNYWQL